MKAPKVVVAGHLCLDIIPPFAGGGRLEPGRLLDVGAATLACGGGVANVGGALLKLGLDARLMGKIGDDAFGAIVRAKLNELSPEAASSLLVSPQESTSYTVVLNPPGLDRLFLHHAGCNDTFGPEDVDMGAFDGADLFYFGYPPLMRRVYEDGGAAFAELLGRVKVLGLTTLLDMAMPDPAGASGRADWRGFLRRVLPVTDAFMPSLEEVCMMLGTPPPDPRDARVLHDLSRTLLDLGTGVVALKLGEYGLYVRTGAGRGLGRAFGDAPEWAERELWSPVFQVDVAGTTGAGDATIAGFITGLLEQQTPEGCLTLANAVGASSVEALDAVSGVGTYADLRERLARGWPRAAHGADQSYWTPGPHGVYRGRHDRQQGGTS